MAENKTHKIRLTSNMTGPDGVFSPGTVRDLPLAEAKQLIDGGYAVSLEAKKRETAAKSKPATEGSEAKTASKPAKSAKTAAKPAKKASK